MTLVICPNLAVDRMLAADRVRAGELTRCRELRAQAGGKGANVARATSAMGGEAVLLGFAGGSTGRRIVELARAEGLALTAVPIAGEARISTVVLGDDGSVTRLYEIGPAVSAGDERALIGLAAGGTAGDDEWAVITGAAPPGVSPGFYAALAAAVRGAGFRVLVDAAGEQLREALRERPDLVKVNLAEACTAVGAPDARCGGSQPAPRTRLVNEGVELAQRLVAAGAGGAVLTLGASGAAGMLSDGPWEVGTPPVDAVNPVGSGDCFAAALTLALQRGEDTATALRLAAAAGAANAVSRYNGHVDPALVARLAEAAHAGPPPGLAADA